MLPAGPGPHPDALLNTGDSSPDGDLQGLCPRTPTKGHRPLETPSPQQIEGAGSMLPARSGLHPDTAFNTGVSDQVAIQPSCCNATPARYRLPQITTRAGGWDGVLLCDKCSNA